MQMQAKKVQQTVKASTKKPYDLFVSRKAFAEI